MVNMEKIIGSTENIKKNLYKFYIDRPKTFQDITNEKNNI